MDRRAPRIGMLAALVVLLATAPASAATILSAQVGVTPSGPVMASGFVGISAEYKAIHAYTGSDPKAVDPVLLALLRGLAPGQRPVVRIGGNSTDSTWWPMRGVSPPGGINYSLTGDWMRSTRALAAALGARLIMGINLAGGRPKLARAEARALLGGIGRRYIRALEIGNEADLYGVLPWYQTRRGRLVFARSAKYDLASFTREFSQWRAALPAAPLAGPAFAELTWMNGLGGFLSAEPGLALATFHRYPLRGCVQDPASPVYASIANLLSDQSSAGLAQEIAPYVIAAHAHGVPFRLDELNSAACSGRRGTSDRFASALWVLDTLFNMASVGVDGVNVHTLPGAAYQLFSVNRHAGRWHAFVHPDYYGMRMFAQAFPAGARLLPVSAPGGAVKVWATRAPDGRSRVVLINKDPVTPAVVRLGLAGTQSPASAQALLAPSIEAISGVSFGGQSFGSETGSGELRGTPHATPVYPSSGVYSVTLPAASAMLLTR
ncbi:MAG: hypothetical protein DLM64_12565 [Solirubrobacterales bacterium]|nr:MAG: hypothetical protein DLM64_12565 [Solirubrobacterales bacterium]